MRFHGIDPWARRPAACVHGLAAYDGQCRRLFPHDCWKTPQAIHCFDGCIDQLAPGHVRLCVGQAHGPQPTPSVVLAIDGSHTQGTLRGTIRASVVTKNKCQPCRLTHNNTIPISICPWGSSALSHRYGASRAISLTMMSCRDVMGCTAMVRCAIPRTPSIEM